MSASSRHSKPYAILRVIGEDLDPIDVSEAFRLPSDHTHRKGEPRLRRHALRGVQHHAPYAEGMWSMSSRDWVEAPDVDTHIVWILDQIEPRAEEISRLLARGIRVDITCCLIDKPEAPPTVPARTLSRVAQLGLELDVDRYSMSEGPIPRRVRTHLEDETGFANVDLDLVADFALKPLVAALPGLCLLHATDEAPFEAHLEVDGCTRTPVDTLIALLEAVESLPADFRKLWDACRSRRFDIGITSGLEPHAWLATIPPDVLSRIAAARAEIGLTIYGTRVRELLKDEK